MRSLTEERYYNEWLDNISTNNNNAFQAFNRRITIMMSNEDQLMIVGFMIGFAAGVVVMIIITN